MVLEDEGMTYCPRDVSARIKALSSSGQHSGRQILRILFLRQNGVSTNNASHTFEATEEDAWIQDWIADMFVIAKDRLKTDISVPARLHVWMC